MILVVERGISNLSFLYLNYTTQQLLKSVKIIFVATFGFAFGQGPSMKQAIYASGLAVGLVVFSIAEARGTHHFSNVGVALVVFSLFLSSLYSNLQQFVMANSSASSQQAQSELVFWQYALGSCMLLLVTGINGELLAGVRLFIFEPIVFFKILAYSLPLYLGIQLLLQITNEFGATMTTAVTATRKVLTFVMSYLLLPRKSKPLSMLHIVGVGISFASTFLIQSSAKSPARGGSHKIHDHDMLGAASSPRDHV